MKNWISKNYKTLIISAFLIPIITVALVSISHVTKWYGLSNPISWAVYLSIGIEIAALSALAAISADMGRKVYFPFGIVTLIQFIGNIYFAYSYIDITNPAFISWVELVSPLLEYIGVDPTDMVGHKRFLAFFAGGMLPIISLSFLHMLVKFTQSEKNIVESVQPVVKESPESVGEETPVVDAKDIVGEVSRVRLSQEDLDLLEKYLNRNNYQSPIENEINHQEEKEEYIPTQQEEDENHEINDVFLIEDHLISEEPIVTPEPTIQESTPVEESVTEEPQFFEDTLLDLQPIEDTATVNESEVIVEESITEPEPTIENPVVEEVQIIEEPIIVDEPIVEQSTIIEDNIVEEPQIIEETIIVDEPVVEEPTIDELPNEEEKKN